MTEQPSDRARKAADENAAFARMLIDARWEGLAEGLSEWCLAKNAWDAGKAFATFERDQPPAEQIAENANCSDGLVGPIAFETPVGDTFEEWRENVRKTKLYQRGDTVLVWVNEGDLHMPAIPTADAIARLEVALRAMSAVASHTEECPFYDSEPCDCGYDAARSHMAAALTNAAAPAPSNLHKTQIAPAAPATGEVVEMLREARRQLEYLDGRWPTGTTPCIIARIDRALNGGS